MPAAARSPRLPARPHIRWDRVGRIALLLVLLGVIALYINPARSWWSTKQESTQRGAEVTELERENKRLRERRAQLKDPRMLENEARRLGMVKPGERAFVVEGLPRTQGR
ncbi:MAG TPA: septum formation initiator family protein [Solirubrobacteraceae bacterium]|nr:septum formation initiator family protein [Solirubrobacteraceae bacterium]